MDGCKKITTAAQGLLTAILYCCSFYLAWHASFDQMYLPAGLRVAALLLLPRRLLPWMLLADVSSLLILRVPAIKTLGVDPVWAYGSPWVLTALFAAVPLAIRARLKGHRLETWLVPTLLAAAVWGAACTIGVNIMLAGPASTISGTKFARFAVGDYLGMLMVVLPALLWLRRHEPAPRRLHLHGAAAGLATAVLFSVAALSPLGSAQRVILMALLIAPAIILTCLHGWRGAAVGVVLANIAIALLLQTSGELGSYDAGGFVAQVLLAVAATGLVVLGSRISLVLAAAKAKAQAERQALNAARASYWLSERSLRERAIGYVDIHVQINKLRRDIETYLRSRGHAEAALRMIRTGYIQAQLLDEYIQALYPLEIETHGLFHIYRSVKFANACHSELHVCLRGQPQTLSVGLQLAAYRCTLQAVACLPPSTRHTIKARVGSISSTQGIAVSIFADTAHIPPRGRRELEAMAELSSRVRSHGGTCRHRHARKISLLLVEPVGSRSLSLFGHDEPEVAARGFL